MLWGKCTVILLHFFLANCLKFYKLIIVKIKGAGRKGLRTEIICWVGLPISLFVRVWLFIWTMQPSEISGNAIILELVWLSFSWVKVKYCSQHVDDCKSTNRELLLQAAAYEMCSLHVWFVCAAERTEVSY